MFVEGKTENEILETLFSPFNIKIKPLNGCDEVIDTYKKYYSFHTHIRDVQFCFLIDKDTRSKDDIDKIRNSDETFFDNHFIIMNKHEIENYLLDTKLILNIFKKHKSINDDIKIPDENTIITKIKEIADKNKEIVLKKTLQNLNQNSLHKIKLAISSKEIEVTNKNKYEQEINNIFNSNSITDTREIILKNFLVIEEINNKWENEWINLCDGKIVLHQLKSYLAKELEITPNRVITELIKTVQETKTHDFNAIINNILNIFK